MQKLKIRSSHLLLRFYPEDGWNRKLLESFVDDPKSVRWSGFIDHGTLETSPEGKCGYWICGYTSAGQEATLDLLKMEQLAESIIAYNGEEYKSGSKEFREYARRIQHSIQLLEENQE